MSLNDQDKNLIENIARKEIQFFLANTNVHKIVSKVIQEELGEKDVDLTTKVIIKLFNKKNEIR